MGSSNIGKDKNTYLNSLIDYVYDVKPYRTKLNSKNGSITETYLFNDLINVAIKESTPKEVIFLGADTLDRSLIATLTDSQQQALGTFGKSRPFSDSWQHKINSDGQRLIWPLPNFTIPKYESHASLNHFTIGSTDEYAGIPGLTKGVLDVKRFDGPGITLVSKNGNSLQESSDYFISQGVFSAGIKIISGKPTWIDNSSIQNVFDYQTAELVYDDISLLSGTITGITSTSYSEYIIKIISIIPNSKVTVSITGYQNGLISVPTVQHQFNWPSTTQQTYSDANITFKYETNPQVGDITTPTVNEEWVITPKQLITAAPDAIEEVWSLIKTNPIIFQADISPIFTGAITRTNAPAISIHTQYSEDAMSQISGEIVWNITFSNPHTYVLSCIGLSGYPKTIDLYDGCSYRDDNIGFTLIPVDGGFVAGDAYDWVTTTPKHYKVYGSVTGWSLDAKIGEWYWNGKIGFKIPDLEYRALASSTTIATSLNGSDGPWTSVVNNTQTITSIDFSQGMFLIAGKDGIVGGSEDGITWYQNIYSVIENLSSPIDSNAFFIILGSNGEVYTSRTGENWNKSGISLDASLNDSLFLPNFLTDPSLQAPNNKKNCLIVVGDHGEIFTSVEGISWQLQTSGTSNDLNAITYSDDYIIVVGNNGTILKSTDRIMWTPVISNTTSNLNDVIFVNGVLTAIGDNGTILRSIDQGNTWLNLGAFSNGKLLSIAHGNNKYIIVSSDSFIAESNNGITWDRYASKSYNGVSFGNNKFVVVGGNVVTPSNQFTPIGKISSNIEPSVYTITFTEPTSSITDFTYTVTQQTYSITGKDDNGNILLFSNDDIGSIQVFVDGIPTTDIRLENHSIIFNTVINNAVVTVTTPVFNGSATVFNNIHGYRAPLKANVDWSDEFCAFRINSIHGTNEFNIGDQIQVYVTEASKKFFSNNTDTEVAYLNSTASYPLRHSKHAIIIKNCNIGDSIIIDKAFYDKIFLKIKNATYNYPELGSSGDNIPLFFKFYDRLTNGIPSSVADFSDLATYIEAYSGATGQLAFSITSPRFKKTNRASQSTLTFSKKFVEKYLPFNTEYWINVFPDETYGQRINVKVTENLKIYERITMRIFEPVIVSITENEFHWYHTVAAVFFGEGPSTGYYRYEITNLGIRDNTGAQVPYVYEMKFITPAMDPSDQAWTYPFSIGIQEGGALLLEKYDTGDYDEYFYDEVKFQQLPGNAPSIQVEEDTIEIASTSFTESLVIVQRTIADQSGYDVLDYDVDNYDLPIGIEEVAGFTVTHLIFNYNKSQPIGSIVPGPLSGLTINQASDEYRITMQNVPVSLPTTYLVAPESDLNNIQSGPITYSSSGVVTDFTTFLFVLPIGLTAPFRLWII